MGSGGVTKLRPEPSGAPPSSAGAGPRAPARHVPLDEREAKGAMAFPLPSVIDPSNLREPAQRSTQGASCSNGRAP